MTRPMFPIRDVISTMCTITVQHTEETLEAHVELDDGLLPKTGDRITVYGSPVQVAYGSTLKVRRDAQLVRGNVFDKAWMRLKSLFDVSELYEVSFSPRSFK